GLDTPRAVVDVALHPSLPKSLGKDLGRRFDEGFPANRRLKVASTSRYSTNCVSYAFAFQRRIPSCTDDLLCANHRSRMLFSHVSVPAAFTPDGLSASHTSEFMPGRHDANLRYRGFTPI